MNMDLNTSKNSEIKIHKDNAILKMLKVFSVKDKTNVSRVQGIDETTELLDSIKNARMDWISATINFDYANDQDVVDYYAYKIKACQVRYNYLLKKAKERGIKVNLPDSDLQALY